MAYMLRVVVRVRRMDHRGYCSDSMCEADAELVTITMPSPPELYTNYAQMLTVEQLALLEPPPLEMLFVNGESLKLNAGSGYCETCGSPWPDVGDHHDAAVDIVCAMGMGLFLGAPRPKHG